MQHRELKKIKTRKAISDMATILFIEKGYQAVTTAEIAQRAEVSPATLFNYFPTKESLVFDEDSEREAELVKAVKERAEGQSVHQALLEAGLRGIDALKEERKHFEKFMAFVERTPELAAYSRQMWSRHEMTLAATIRDETKEKLTKLESEAIARFILDAYHRSFSKPNPKAALRTLFHMLERGWKG